MSKLNLDELLAKMDSVAEAVNKFTSESVQQMAFTALIQSIGATVKSEIDDTPSETHTQQTPDKKVSSGNSGGKKAKVAKKIITADKSLDLRPQGKTSFRDFAEKKQPVAQNERNVVAVYYLTDTLELEGISLAHVLTCYRDAGWKLPSDIVNSMQVTASKTGWVDSSDSSNILLTSPGRNAVEFDLPKAK